MKLQAAPLTAIKAGSKVIESRLYDEKRQQIQLGDQIIFRNMADLDDAITVKVDGLLRYATFSAMFSDLPASFFGGESISALEEQVYGFYTKEDEAKYGVLGIRISKVE